MKRSELLTRGTYVPPGFDLLAISGARVNVQVTAERPPHAPVQALSFALPMNLDYRQAGHPSGAAHDDHCCTDSRFRDSGKAYPAIYSWRHSQSRKAQSRHRGGDEKGISDWTKRSVSLLIAVILMVYRFLNRSPTTCERQSSTQMNNQG